MKFLPSILIAGLIVVQLADAHASTLIYRCVGNDGVVKFQDTVCRPGESSREIAMPTAPSIPAIDSPSPADRAPDVPQRSPSALTARNDVAPSMRATVCERQDGSRYLSNNGRGEQRAVPLGMLGIPRDSLADAYAGRDGIGVSAPGLRTAPVDQSAYGQLGAAYVWVEDPCSPISGEQLCDFLDGQIEDAQRRLRFAFSDTKDKVKQELESLLQRAQECRR